jgi:ATP-dependent DNA helicase RecG
MAPTEVLARQHYESITAMFEEYGVDIRVTLLVGSQTAKERRQVYAMMESGEAGIVVGTHALIQEKAVYNNLGLVITDEQHRFGVNQRRTLSDKGENPHILVMSATPIPRTLGIIIYGDLDISVIDELPANRLPIKNCVVDDSYRPKAYSFITNQVREGRQAYVICPMVSEGDEDSNLENVVDYTKKLRNELPKDIRVEYLHGKMKPVEKNDIMERFLAGEIQVLVSTTVVEVGVNVPNASVMMIENAERFGLAQLHQLRGRVGRGKHQSYCIFVSGNKSKKTKDRLQILAQTNDGFKIAEEDLKLRGPGDFLGVRQSGDMDFGIADIYADSRMLKAASESAEAILNTDPLLESEENRGLAQKVSEYTVKCLCRINL